MLYGILRGVSYFLQIIGYAMWIYCICSWVLSPFNKVMRFLGRIVDPVLRPVRNVMFRIFPRMPIDISPIIAGALLNLVNSLMWRVYFMLAL